MTPKGVYMKLLNEKKYWLISIIIIVGLLLLQSVTIIHSGEVGIRIRFGKVMKQQVPEGIAFQIPGIEKIKKINIQVQKIEVDTNSSSKDLQEVNMKLAVNYQVEKNEANSLYKNVGMNYHSVILEPAIEESIKAITSQYTAEELITHRSDVSKKCMKELSTKVEKYGIKISDFNITNFSFSEEFDKAIEEKQIAEQKVLTAKQELEKEKIEAEKKIVKAEAEKQSNELKGQTINDNIIKEKFIEKWNGELPKVMGNESIMDITSIMNEN